MQRKVVQHNTDTATQLNKYNQLIEIHENFDITYSTYVWQEIEVYTICTGHRCHLMQRRLQHPLKWSYIVNLQESPQKCNLSLTVFHKVHGVSINLTTNKTDHFLLVVWGLSLTLQSLLLLTVVDEAALTFDMVMQSNMFWKCFKILLITVRHMLSWKFKLIKKTWILRTFYNYL